MTALHPELSKRLTLAQFEEALQTEGLFGAAVQVEEWSYPTFYVRFTTAAAQNRLLRFDASNYDFQPLDVEPVDPETRAPLEPSTWMKRDGAQFPPHPLQGGRPFLCIKGTRAYYTHPSHSPLATGERWERHRRDLKIVDIIRFIRDRFSTGGWA